MMPWEEQTKIFPILKDRDHTVIEQVSVRERTYCIPFIYCLKPLTHAHSQQRAWLSSKSDLIKLSDNLNISHDP